VRVLIVYAHPRDESLCAAALVRAEAGLRSGGHDVEVRDLYAAGFDPVMARQEHALHREPPGTKPGISEDVRLVGWAEALVFIYPTWWGGQPAILKGWLDRVMVEGVAYTRAAGGTRVRPRLKHIRRIAVVTTHGSSKWVNSLQGEPGKRVLLRGLRALVHPRARGRWIAAYGLDRSTESARAQFLDRVERRLAGL
jgi:NAD(P)H dehydrogenase (quinone)